MTTYVIQKEALAQAAVKLREVLLSARKDFEQKDLHVSVADVDYALKLLDPISLRTWGESWEITWPSLKSKTTGFIYAALGAAG